jgi:hypothetical protein
LVIGSDIVLCSENEVDGEGGAGGEDRETIALRKRRPSKKQGRTAKSSSMQANLKSCSREKNALLNMMIITIIPVQRVGCRIKI